VARDIFALATSLLTDADAIEARKTAAGVALAGRESKSGAALGRFRLLSFASKKGGV